MEQSDPPGRDFENLWTNTNILMDRSLKFHLISQMVCSPWLSFIPSLWNRLFFPTQVPNSPLKVFIFLHWGCRKPWDYTTNKDFPAECQLCCGIPLKPVVSHLWGTDLRSVGCHQELPFSFLGSKCGGSFLNKIVSNCSSQPVDAMPTEAQLLVDI